MGPRQDVEVEESLPTATRIEITEKYTRAYTEAPKKGKIRILGQVVEVMGWNRDHASLSTRTVLGFLFPNSVVASSLRAALAAPTSEAWQTGLSAAAVILEKQRIRQRIDLPRSVVRQFIE